MWELIIIGTSLYIYGLVPIAIKKIGATEKSRARKLLGQYVFTAFLVGIAIVIAGPSNVHWSSTFFLIILGIGIANAVGTYWYWKAIDISLTRTSMLSQTDDLFAIGLAFLFLGELELLSPVLVAGIVLAIVSASLFLYISHQNKEERVADIRRLLVLVLGFSLIWGMSIFSQRFFNVEGINLLTFISAWYAGAFVGALFVRYFLAGDKEIGTALKPNQMFHTFVLAVLILSSLAIQYWIREFTPIAVIQPIQLAAQIIIPTLAGLFIFKERAKITQIEKWLLTISLLGIMLVMLSF